MDLAQKNMHFLYGIVFMIGAVVLNGLSIVLGAVDTPLPLVHIHFVLSIVSALVSVYYLFQTFFADAFLRKRS